MGMDYVAWVRRANSRWIVHHGLSSHANAYLDHLERNDAERLIESCRHSHLLAQERPPGDDPKPWFYAGLFSLATPAEIREFLAGHWLLRMTVTTLPQGLAQNAAGHAVSGETLRKIQRIREAVARVRNLKSGAPHEAPASEPRS
jgi:hypothetical protein